MIEEILLRDSKPVGKNKVIRLGLRVPDANDGSILLYNLEHNNFVRLPLVIKNEAGKLMLHVWAKERSAKSVELHGNPPTHSIEIELDGNKNDNKEIDNATQH